MIRITVLYLLATSCAFAQQKVPPEREAALKADLAGQIDGMSKMAQVMVDSVFSFGELGFQEFETSKYLTGILEKEGFRIERGVAGIPTAFVATWGQGRPVIALGSDIEDRCRAGRYAGGAFVAPGDEPRHGLFRIASDALRHRSGFFTPSGASRSQDRELAHRQAKRSGVSRSRRVQGTAYRIASAPHARLCRHGPA